MEVIVKSSPKIEIELATKVVKVGGKVTVDSALSTESENPVQNKVITEELGKKATKEGNYPSLRVGTADTAIDLAGRGESVPAEFGFRASGGKSIKDGRAYIKRIKGNSVVWNQPINNVIDQTAENGWWIRQGADCASIEGNTITLYHKTGVSTIPQATQKINFVAGHKYLIVGSMETNDTTSGFLVKISQSSDMYGNTVNLIAKHLGDFVVFYTAIEGLPFLSFSTYKASNDGGQQTTLKDFHITDLTQMFQAGNEPTTIEDFYARVATLGVDMNAYNEGQVIHCNTESIKSVGDNQWKEEELVIGRLAETTGQPQIVSKEEMMYSPSYTKVLPNTQYFPYVGTYNGSRVAIYIYFYDVNYNYISNTSGTDNKVFTTPSNAWYIRFFVYNTGGVFSSNFNDICISLYHSGWKAEVDNTYKPYWQDTLPLPIIRKYFPQGMKKAGTAHDEVRYNKASGKWEAVQRIGSVDLGTLSWRLGSGRMIASANFASASHSANTKVGNILTQKYMTLPYNNDSQPSVYTGSLGIAILKDGGDYYFSVYDSSYTDAASFKTSLQGVILYYELAEPIVTELDAEDQNFRDYYNVADFGTEMSQSSVPSAPFSADIIYQFNAVDMVREHEIEITELQTIITEQQSVIATMQAQLTSLINGGQ